MLTPDQLKTKKASYQAILDKGRTENRSFTAAEQAEMDALKPEIETAEAEIAEAAANASQHRSGAAARIVTPVTARIAKKQTLNSMCRSITKGGAEVGDVDVIKDVVRVYIAQSPIFAAHQNKQLNLTGTAYTYPKIVAGSGGYKKTEGVDATTDTGSTLTMITQTFSTYSSQQILVSQEMLDDAGFDIGAEIESLGMAKSTQAFDADAATALETYNGSPTQTVGTNVWAMSDIVAAYFEIPQRNRFGVKFIANHVTMAAVVALLTNVNAPQAALIGLDKPENLLIDDNIATNLLIIANPTLALAIGMKQQVRIFVLEQSKGRIYEVQPRMAVGLRDGTAVSGRLLKTS